MLAKFEKITDLGKSINSTFPEALTLSITLGFKIGCLSDVLPKVRQSIAGKMLTNPNKKYENLI